jgi:twinkle protein
MDSKASGIQKGQTRFAANNGKERVSDMKKNFSDFGITIPFGASTKSKLEMPCPRCSAIRKKKTAPCLVVWIEDGNWSCIHCGWKGSIYTKDERAYSKPELVIHSKLSEKALAWFIKERKIPEAVLVRNKIQDSFENGANWIQFPFFRDGQLINVKFRDGKKRFHMVKDAERILYKWDDLFTDKLRSWCIICEGEIDALSFEAIGIPNAISVPDGAPAENAKNYATKFSFLDSAIDTLLQLERIYIAVDNDAPGMVLEQELVRRLGAEKCIKISFPEGCKDANDVLVKLGSDALWECFKQAKEYPIAGIISPVELTSEVIELYEKGIYKLGIETGWESLNEFYRPTLGQMTILTAMPNIGKSELIDGLMMNIATLEGWRFAVFSPENYPHSEHAVRLMMKYVNMPFFNGYHLRMDEKQRDEAMFFLHEHFRWIDLGEEEAPTLTNVLAKAEHLVRAFGINGLIIDPYNELDHTLPKGMTETNYISRFLSTLRRFTRRHNLHTWLIAHPTKLQKVATNKKNDDGTFIMTYQVPTLYDIAGSAHFRNKADVGISLGRDQMNEANIMDIHIQKMRFMRSGKIGKASLKWDSVTGNFSSVISQSDMGF